MIALHFLIRNRYTKLINHLASTSVYRVHQVCIFFVQKGFPRTIRQNPSGPIISPDRELSNRCYLFSLFMAPARFLYLTQVSTFHGMFPLVISFFIFIQQLVYINTSSVEEFDFHLSRCASMLKIVEFCRDCEILWPRRKLMNRKKDLKIFEELTAQSQ